MPGQIPSFGVVTSFEYWLHPVGPDVMFAAPMYPLDTARDILPRWRDFVEDTPEEVTAAPAFWSIPDIPDFPEKLQIHYVGVSNFAAWQLLQSQWIADVHDWEGVSVIQPRFKAVDHHPYTVDPSEQALPGLLDACRRHNVAVASYGPLAGGFLTGKYERGPDGAIRVPDDSRGALDENFGPFSDRAWDVLAAVQEIAEAHNATAAQVALWWVMDVDCVTSLPIAGARSPDQVPENVGAVDLSLSSDELTRITEAGRPDTGGWAVYVD